MERMKERCNHPDILLDVGTGGGENVLNIASSAKLLIGIDDANAYDEKRHILILKKSGYKMLSLFKMVFLKLLTFPHCAFEIASSCHAPFLASELAKVMKRGAFLNANK